LSRFNPPVVIPESIRNSEDRNVAAAHAVVAARPTDMVGPAVQLQYFQHVLDGGSEPNRQESLMLAHVVSQLAAMARLRDGAQPQEQPAQAAGPLFATF
jgi:hypothetical protein